MDSPARSSGIRSRCQVVGDELAAPGDKPNRAKLRVLSALIGLCERLSASFLQWSFMLGVVQPCAICQASLRFMQYQQQASIHFLGTSNPTIESQSHQALVQPTQPTSQLNCCCPRTRPIDTMSGKYAFTKSLKEVRFLFCQTGEHSAATR